MCIAFFNDSSIWDLNFVVGINKVADRNRRNESRSPRDRARSGSIKRIGRSASEEKRIRYKFLQKDF